MTTGPSDTLQAGVDQTDSKVTTLEQLCAEARTADSADDAQHKSSWKMPFSINDATLPELIDAVCTQRVPHSTDVPPKRRRKGNPRSTYQSHRLHYRWSHVEADRCGCNAGSPTCPLPKADRFLYLDERTEYWYWPVALSDDAPERILFSGSHLEEVYKSIDYNTFLKNGALKLTEVELFFLSQIVTRKTSKDFAVVYLGVGSGERFRYLRDWFFPEMAVIAFDPLDEYFATVKNTVVQDSERWNSDGTNFTFLLRCFDAETDPPWICEQLKGRTIILISDIRGVAKKKNDSFDKAYDQELQWRAIQNIRPIKSLLKFTFPEACDQCFYYAPGQVLKQAFTYYNSRETRLIVDGVPEKFRRYNAWELYTKMMFHHENVRGMVFQSDRHLNNSTRCLDYCFDCSVLWDTVSMYARQNDMDPYPILEILVRYQVYTPPNDAWRLSSDWEDESWKGQTASIRLWDVVHAMGTGSLTRAVAILEACEQDKEDARDWCTVIETISEGQPELVRRLQDQMPKPATARDVILALASLSAPFTLVRSMVNELLYPYEADVDSAEQLEADGCSSGRIVVTCKEWF